MVVPESKSDLTPSRRWLLSEMQRINYGRIEGLTVRHGQPAMDPPPRIVREIKFGAENGPRAEASIVDFALKAQVRDLFAQLETLRNGVVPCIEIQRGLPFRMTLEEVAA